jgi:hypothetical protein
MGKAITAITTCCSVLIALIAVYWWETDMTASESLKHQRYIMTSFSIEISFCFTKQQNLVDNNNYYYYYYYYYYDTNDDNDYITVLLICRSHNQT